MSVNPEETSLWRAAFADDHCNTNSQKEARNELLVELRKLDKHVEQLLAKIPEDCKGLTLHGITHVHQLWDVASVLCGPEYQINPLEGFVLGAAFLVHDAGLTAAAYPGGLQGLKASRLDRDLVSNGLKRADPNRTVEGEDIDNAPQDVGERALFDLLRLIHADRAAKLLDQAYVHPIIRTSFTLVPPDMLLDLGETIGKVAASHHWDMKKVDRAFSAPVPPPATYPGWTVDEVKLACILRAADACAIDERRARTMSFIIKNRAASLDRIGHSKSFLTQVICHRPAKLLSSDPSGLCHALKWMRGGWPLTQSPLLIESCALAIGS